MSSTIAFLADHLDTIPILVRCFRDQWPDYYANKSSAQMEQDFLSQASRHCLPSRLVAFESDQFAGTIVLRRHDCDVSPEFTPELGGLYVVKEYRGQGIGTQLVRSGLKLALDQGYETVYATTRVAANILKGLGWEFIKTIDRQDGQVGLYRCEL